MRCQPRIIRNLLTLSLAALLALAATPVLSAQSAPTPVHTPQLLFEEPFEIPSLGLRVFLPEDSLVDLSRLQGGKTSVQVIPQGQGQPWVLQIWNFVSKEPDLTLTEAMDNIVAQKRKAKTRQRGTHAPTSLVRVFDRQDDLLVGKQAASRAYFDLPKDSSGFVSGYTIFNIAPRQFVVFQFDCATSSFARLREMYELLVASADFRDSEELNQSRAASLIAGEKLLSRFNNDDLKSTLTDKPRFFRIYRPAQSGAPADAQEIAYQRITMRRGQAGEVSGKSQSRWRPADREEGFLVIVEARTLLSDATTDSVATFYLSDDRENELWSNRMVVRRGPSEEQWTESGIRKDGKLIVKTYQDGKEPTEIRWDDLPSTYISRVESYLLPKLTIRHELAGEFGFYAYDSGLGKLSIRKETIERRDADIWTLLTQASENSPPAGSLMNAQGEIIQRDLPGGEVMKPIEARQLRDLWRRKGLPLK